MYSSPSLSGFNLRAFNTTGVFCASFQGLCLSLVCADLESKRWLWQNFLLSSWLFSYRLGYLRSCLSVGACRAPLTSIEVVSSVNPVLNSIMRHAGTVLYRHWIQANQFSALHDSLRAWAVHSLAQIVMLDLFHSNFSKEKIQEVELLEPWAGSMIDLYYK